MLAYVTREMYLLSMMRGFRLEADTDWTCGRIRMRGSGTHFAPAGPGSVLLGYSVLWTVTSTPSLKYRFSLPDEET